MKKYIALLLIPLFVFFGAARTSFAAWSYVTSFESGTFSTGDLNGQDSWTGGTSFDVVNTQASDGTQSVAVAANDNISRTITQVTDDPTTVYFSVRTTDATTADNWLIRFYADTGYTQNVGSFYLGGATQGTFHWRESGGTWHAAGTYDVDTWYDVKLEIDYTNDCVTVTIDGGTPTACLDNSDAAALSDIEAIRLYYNNGDADVPTFYFDNLSDTAPTQGGENQVLPGMQISGDMLFRGDVIIVLK